MLDYAFMFVFFTLKKLVFKSGSTPPRYLHDTSSIPPWHLAVCWASQAFSYRNPDTSSTPSGSIEKAPTSSIAFRPSFCSWIWWVVPGYLLDTSTIEDHFLDTYLDSFLDTSRRLPLLSFTEGLYIHSSRPVSHFFDLSWSVCTYSSPKHTLSLTPNLFICDFFKLFQDSSSLGKFLFSHSSCISCFET